MYCLPKKYVSYTKTASLVYERWKNQVSYTKTAFLVYERRKYQVSYTKRAFLVYGGWGIQPHHARAET